jgi:type I restriction enzyme S subunit
MSGITKDSKKQGDDYREVPYLRVANVQRLQLNLSEVKTIPAKESTIASYRLEPGDILLNEGGDRDKLGRGWIWQGQISECIHQNHVFRARIRDGKAIPKWIAYYANTNEARAYFLATGKQTTNLASISKKNLSALPVPLPPVHVQETLVAQIDKQLSRLDEAVNTLQGIQAKLKQARASILKAAVEGRLVETEAEIARREKTDYESGGLLLERILYLRENSFRIARQSLNNKIKYPRAFTPSQAKTNVLPEGWAIATIDQLTNYFNGSFIVQGWSPKCLSREAYSSEWCVMKTTAIQPLRFDSGSNKALPQGLDPRPDLELTSGDLLITRAGPRSRVGICCLIEKTRSKVMLCDKAYRIRPSRLCLGKYLEIALNSQSASHSIEQIKTGINDSGVNITQSGFLNLLIPLPPLSEQNRIVDEVDRRFSVLVQVEATVQTSLARCGLLRQAILKRAFGG